MMTPNRMNGEMRHTRIYGGEREVKKATRECYYWRYTKDTVAMWVRKDIIFSIVITPAEEPKTYTIS